MNKGFLINRKPHFWQRLGEWVLKYRWWLVVFASGAFLLFELVEYELYKYGFSEDSRFIVEVLFYVILLPLSTGLALTGLAASRSELSWSVYYKNLKNNLDRQLYNARSYDELGQIFMEFIRVVMPLSSAALYKYDQQVDKYKVITNWSLDKSSGFSDTTIQCTAEQCPLLTMLTREDVIGIHPCQDSHLNSLAGASPYYCMPFLFSNSRVGAARLHFAFPTGPSPEQDRLLKEISPVIVSVFQRIDLEQRVKKQNDSLSTEHQRLARDVHDSLGHSLAYLRLRLDQISLEIDHTQMNIIQQEVEALRDVAKEAYEQMREVLISLSPEGNLNIGDNLLKYAERISQLSGFTVDINQDGRPRALRALVRRNIFYIFQEALTNIEKHAHAGRVNINLKWQEFGLEMIIEDDGIGYDTAQQIPDGHFGLLNMHQRALECQAELSISSQPGQGTRLTLSIPYEETP